MNGYHHTLQFTKLVTLRRMISSSLGRLGIKKLFASFKETKEYFVWIISEHFSTPEDPRLNLAIGNIFLYWKSFIGK